MSETTNTTEKTTKSKTVYCHGCGWKTYSRPKATCTVAPCPKCGHAVSVDPKPTGAAPEPQAIGRLPDTAPNPADLPDYTPAVEPAPEPAQEPVSGTIPADPVSDPIPSPEPVQEPEAPRTVYVTTAPQAYDGFSVRDEGPADGTVAGVPARRVSLEERDREWYFGKVGSGSYGVCTESEWLERRDRPAPSPEPTNGTPATVAEITPTADPVPEPAPVAQEPASGTETVGPDQEPGTTVKAAKDVVQGEEIRCPELDGNWWRVVVRAVAVKPPNAGDVHLTLVNPSGREVLAYHPDEPVTTRPSAVPAGERTWEVVGASPGNNGKVLGTVTAKTQAAAMRKGAMYHASAFTVRTNDPEPVEPAEPVKTTAPKTPRTKKAAKGSDEDRSNREPVIGNRIRKASAEANNKLSGVAVITEMWRARITIYPLAEKMGVAPEKVMRWRLVGINEDADIEAFRAALTK